MRRPFEKIKVAAVAASSWFTVWTRCDHCGYEIAKEPMYRAEFNGGLNPRNPTSIYCQQCAPTKEVARSLFRKKYLDAPRPKAPPPPKPRNSNGKS